MSTVNTLNESQFESEILNYNGVAAVKFWATWCVPCKGLAPVFEAVAADADSSVRFFECDVDENPNLASGFYIRSVPVVIFFKNGEEVDRLVGPFDQEVYEEKIASLL